MWFDGGGSEELVVTVVVEVNDDDVDEVDDKATNKSSLDQSETFSEPRCTLDVKDDVD